MSNKSALNITPVLLIILAIFLFVTTNIGRYKTDIIDAGDQAGYYCYLPALFIHQDIGFVEKISEHKDYYNQNITSKVNKYTSGVAVLQAPFFLGGHLLAKITGAKQDGYSYPYLLAIMIGILFYVTFGLLLLSKVLLKYFDKSTTAIVILAIALATNLFYFTVSNNQMSHGYSFFLLALLIYATDQWYSHQKLKYAILIGISAGIMTLIRPIDILVLSIPVFYNITKISDISTRIKLIKDHWTSYAISVILFAMCAIPQLVYWKLATDSWLYYSYGSEGFDFTNPRIWSGFTAAKNGWLLYTPIMMFSLLGLLFLLKKRRWALPIFLFFPLYVFIVYSWHNWYYINSFGSRPLVGTYALLAIPMAYFVDFCRKYNWSKWVLYLVFMFLGVLNIFQTYQESWGILKTSTMTYAYYQQSFGKTQMDYPMLSAYETDIIQPYHTTCQEALFVNSIQDSTVNGIVPDKFHSPPYSIRMNKKNKYFNILNKSIGDLKIKEGQYLKISGWFNSEKHVGSKWNSSSIIVSILQNKEEIHWSNLWINNKINADRSNYALKGRVINEWGEVYFYYKIPPGISPNQIVKIYLYNPTNIGMLVDDLKVQICDEGE
ncbi:MAG: hypothetical protein V3V14_07875 [Saprospiraceae bacterium]